MTISDEDYSHSGDSVYGLHVTCAIVFLRERMLAITYRTHKWFYPVRVVRFYVLLHVMLPLRS